MINKRSVRIPIDKVTLDRSVYPRDTINKEIVDYYCERLGYSDSPPIKVVLQKDGSYLLIDGNYRLEAHRKAGKDEIEADILDVDENDLTMLSLLAIEYNLNDRGLFVEPNNLKQKVIQFYKAGAKISELSSLVRIPERTIQEWTKVETEKKIVSLHEDLGKSPDEIADELGLQRNFVNTVLYSYLERKKQITSENSVTRFR